MARYTVAVEFEWDSRKSAANLRKHKVSFDEASTVFGDALSATAADPDHAAHEHRYITIGMSGKRRLLMVAHTERGGRIRIISARTLTRIEKRTYEESER
jgi:uncharacterized protein